jgi:hypothetical protein
MTARAEQMATQLMLGPDPVADTKVHLLPVPSEEPLWRVAVLSGVLTPRYSDCRMPALAYVVQCDARTAMRPGSSFARRFAVERMRQDGIAFDPARVSVAVELSDLHAVVRDGAAVVERRTQAG